MLGGKHFGGSQQRALIAGVDHLQHRQHRDDRLARADLTLQHPVHWTGRGEFGRQHVEHFALAMGQFERQLLHQRDDEPVVFTRCRRPGFTQFAVSPRHQRPLEADGLVERKPLAGALTLGLALGEVDGTQRLVFGYQVPFPQKRFRQRLLDGVEHVDHLTHTRIDVPALHFGAGGVDREEFALERCQQFITGCP